MAVSGAMADESTAGRHVDDVTVVLALAAAEFGLVDDGAWPGQISVLAVPSPSSPAEQPAIPRWTEQPVGLFVSKS